MPRRRNSQRVDVKHWKYFDRSMYMLQYNPLKRNGFWIRWHRRAVQSSSTVCDSIDRHARVLRTTENSARSMTCSGRATLKEKSDRWSLPPSCSEELFEAILGWKHFRRPDAREILLLSDLFSRFSSFSLPSLFLFELRHLSHHYAFFIPPRINECFLLVAFSDYRIVLPLVVFSLRSRRSILAISRTYC